VSLTDPRIPLIVGFIGISGIVFAGHTTGRFYPWTIAIFFITMSTLLLLAIRGTSLYGILGGALIAGMGYRIYFNFHSPTPVGISTHSYPGRIDAVIEAGQLGVVGGYYGSPTGAPFQRLLFTEFAIVAGVDGYASLFLYAILIAILYPLLVVGILRSFSIVDHRILGLGIVLALVTTEGLRRSYWVRHQVLGVLFGLLAIYLLMKYLRNPNGRDFVLIAGFSGAMAFSHKLPLALFAAMLGTLVVLYILEYITWSEFKINPVYQIGGLLVFITALAFTQLLYMGNLIRTLVNRTFRFLNQFEMTDDGTEINLQSTSSVEADAAVEVLPGMIANVYEYPSTFSLFVERGHGIWLLLAAGVAWGYLYLWARDERYRKQTLALLAISALGVSLMFVGVVSIRAMNPTRPLHFIEPILVALVAVFIWMSGLLDRWSLSSVGVGLLLVLLILSQVFAMAAAPDYTNSPRYYADTNEATAQTTICEYTPGDVYGEIELGYFNGIDHQSNCISSFGSEADSPLFNAEVTPEDHGTVMTRNDIDTYHGRFDRFSLTWDPMTELRTDYNQVYDSGQVVLFENTTNT